jgi:hypothetical protein
MSTIPKEGKTACWRIAFRCNPYKAKTHFLWINAPDNTTSEQIKRAAYDYKDGLPVDVIDDILKHDFIHPEPHITIPYQLATDGREQDRACPCKYLDEPCNEMCTCKNGLYSTGCLYCCTYGSLEQRKEQAKRLKVKLDGREESKQEAIGFAEWKDNNYQTVYNNGKVVGYRLCSASVKPMNETFTTEQLFDLYNK